MKPRAHINLVSVSLCGALACSLFIPADSLNFVAEPLSAVFSQLAVAILSLVALWSNRSNFRSPPELALLGIIVLVTIPSSLVSDGEPLYAIATSGAVLLFGYAVSSASVRDAKSILQWAVVACYTVALIGVIEAFVIERFVLEVPVESAIGSLQPNPYTEGIRARGPVGNALVLGFVSAASFLMHITYLRTATWTILLGGALSVSGILASGSSSAVAIFLMGCGLIALTRSRARLIGIALLVLGVAYTIASPRVLRFSDAAIRDLQGGDSTHRMNVLKATDDLFRRPLSEVLFGSGYDSIADVTSRGYFVNYPFYVVDNQAVSIFITSGLIGVIAFLIFIVISWKRASVTKGLPCLAALSAMYLSFDTLEWLATSTLLLLVTSFHVLQKTKSACTNESKTWPTPTSVIDSGSQMR